MPDIIKIVPETPDYRLIQEASKLLTKGKLIIYPTETFYGLGAIYSDEKALERIFKIKKRKPQTPLLLLIQELSDLKKLSSNVSDSALAIAEKFWPGPLTLLFSVSPKLSQLVTGNTGKVGCRISSNPVAQKLLLFLKHPLTSTSANITGGKSPTSIDEIPSVLLDSVDVIIDAGKTPGGLPSTIIDVSNHPFAVVRKGAVAPEKILNSL